tara:strand:- start:780 stop:1553 length:774 start_codon:yes stop_codon:yes gene_type:complete
MNMIDDYNKRYATNSKGAVMHLNASDERGIDIIRNNILQFVKTNNFFENCVKFVILDEVDYMTKNAQQALKYLLQSSNYNVRFCLICNYISKIDESLKNEFLCVRFNQLPKNEIHTFIVDICNKEEVDITEMQINKLLDAYNSDIRSMINFIQLNKDNMHNPDFILSNEIWKKLHTFIVEQEEYNTINDYIHEISIHFNCDKKTIIKKYMDYIVRHKTEYITPDFCHLCETILHSPEIDMQILLKHSIYKLQKLFQQ